MMDNNMTNCIKCGSNNISLDISLGKLKCSHCGCLYENTIVTNEVEEIDKLEGMTVSSGALDIKDVDCNMVMYKCGRCSTTIITSELNKNIMCPTCHKNLANNERVGGNLYVDSILPFRIYKDDAINKMNRFMKEGTKFVLDEFTNEYNINNLIACYIPYLVFDAEYDCTFAGTGEREIDWTYDSEDKKTTYYFDGYDIVRSFNVKIKDGSLDEKDYSFTDKDNAYNNLISALNPYDTINEVKIKGNYLNNAVAEVLPISEVKVDEKIKNKLINIAKYGILDDLLFFDRGIRWEKTNIDVKNVKFHYVYLPVWLYFFEDSNKELFYLAVNGRTGEFATHVPFNKKKAFLHSIIKDIIITLTADLFLSIFFLPFILGNPHDNSILYYFIPLLVITTILLLVVGTSSEYKKLKNACLGNHIPGENDDKVYREVDITNRFDNKIYEKKRGSNSKIIGMNDNSNQRREELFMKMHNVKIENIK